MNYDEIQQQLLRDRDILVKQYPFPGIEDQEKLREWFKSTESLQSSTQLLISGIPYRQLIHYKKKLGFHIPRKSTRTYKKKQRILEVPKGWRKQPELLRELIKDYNATEIAIAAGTLAKEVTYWLFKHKIPYKNAKKLHNPCSSFKWCYHHYIILNLTLPQCAELANVSYNKFRQWIIDHKIPLKTATATYYLVPPWVKILKNKLSKLDIVESVITNSECITVKYKNPFPKFYPSIESYYYKDVENKRLYLKYRRDITSDNSVYMSMAPIVYEFGPIIDMNFENEHPAMVMVRRKDLDNKTLLERRVTLNNLIYHLISRGWMNPTYPESLLQSEWDYIKNFNLDKHINTGIFRAVPLGSGLLKKYKQIPYHFFDMSRAWRIMRRPLKLRSILNRLFDGTEDITYTSILKAITYNNGPKIMIPTLYAAIFKKLGVKSVLDLSPGYGAKAMACALLDIKYIPKKSHALMSAIDNGFADFINLDYEWFDEESNEKYDLIVGTDIFSTGLSMIKKYKNRARNIMAFVRKHARDQLEAMYKPTSIVPIIIQVNGEIDYLFIW